MRHSRSVRGRHVVLASIALSGGAGLVSAEPIQAAPPATPEGPAAAAPPANGTAPEAPPAAPQAVAPTPAPTAASTAPPVAPPTPAPLEVSFNFKSATWDQVLDFFSRATGLPIVKEVPLPDGVVDYLSPRSYPLPEALETLNILLQTRGVMLRVEADRLFLQKLDDMKRENIPTFIGKLPDGLTSDQIITLVMPLKNAAAKPVAEQLAQMVAAYGSISAMEKQNALVIVETAAQVRRLERIISELDREDVENIVEFLPIRHAKATEMVTSLTALMGERVVEYVINPQTNQKVKLEETRLGGMTIAADSRTNAIVARGTRAKIDQLKETIALLDVPGAAERRAMRTFALRTLTAPVATQQVAALFSSLPAERRPMVLPASDGLRLTVVGPDTAIAEAAALLVEIDGTAGNADDDMTVSVVGLNHAAPEAVASTARAVLGRQLGLVTLTPGADGRSVVVSGPAGFVESAKAMIAALDRPARSDKALRLTRLVGSDPSAILARAKDLYAAQRDASDARSDVAASYDVATQSAILVGEAPALARFGAVIDQLQAAAGPQPDVRVVTLEHATAQEVSDFLNALTESELGIMFAGGVAGATGAARPLIEPIAGTNTLLVAAQPMQHQVIQSLVRTVDVPHETELPPLRILQLRTADAVNLAQTLMATYSRRSNEERNAKPASITADIQTNALLVAAHPDLLPEIERVVQELNDSNRVDSEGREIRIFPLKVARAAELAKTIDEMFPPPPVPVDPRGRPRPELQKPREVVVRADPQTNALIVDAPVQRMAGFQELVQSLDRAEITDQVSIRTWRLERADVNAAADAIRQLAANGSLGGAVANRRAAVTVTVEPSTRTLVVSAPDEAFVAIEGVLKSLDEERSLPATSLRFFKLVTARAENVAPMLREILAGRMAEEIPGTPAELQALLKVTTDKKSNVLIISAPPSVMQIAEELVKQLDSTASAAGGLEPVIRVHPLTFASASEVSQSLSSALPTIISKVTGEPVSVRLIPSVGANALILVGLESELKDVEALIEPLDARPTLDAVDAKTFELKHSLATRIAPLVQNLLTDQQETDPRIVLERLRRSRGQIDTTPRVRVEADDRTNRLIVSGPQRVVALAEALILELDRPDESAEREIATFTPTNADPSTLAATVRQVLETTRGNGQRSTLQVISEPQSGALLLIGTKEEIARANTLLKSWDERVIDAPSMDLKVLTLKHADPRVVAGPIASLLQDRTRWPERLRQTARAGLSVGQPTVTAEATGPRLLVSAPGELMPLAEALLAELDRPRDGASAIEVRTFTLSQADARGVSDAVRTAMEARATQRPAETRATISPEPSSNAIVATGTPEQLAQIDTIVSGLDAGTPRDQAQVRTLFLKHGRATEVMPLLQSLLVERELIDPKGLPTWAQAEYLRIRQQNMAGKPEVRLVADERLNAIVVAAPASVLDAAEQMVAQLDVERGEGDESGDRSVRLLTLQNADATEVATSLEAIFAEEKDREKPPTVRVSAASNGLLIRASDRQFATIERVIGDIDRATVATSRQMRTIPIDQSKASAQEIAEMLRRLLGTDDAGTTVEVISLEELIKREAGAKPTPPSGEKRSMGGAAHWPVSLHAIVLESIFAVVVQDEDNAATDAGASADGAAAGPDVTIAVDPRTNSLVLVGSPRAVERLAQLARQAQEQVPDAPQKMRVITLDRATDPERLRALVAQVLGRITPPGGVAGDLAKRVGLLADPGTNALVIAANDNDFRAVTEILVALGSAPTANDIPIRTIVLERASAAAVAQAVQRFEDERAKLSGARGRREQRRFAIVGDPTSNTILVAAEDEDFKALEAIVKQFDSPAASAALEMRMYPLRHARAGEIERTVQAVVSDLTWGQPFFFGPRNNESSRRDEVAVRSAPHLNALLVTGTGDKFQLVQQIIEALDTPTSPNATRVVKLYPVKHSDVDLVAEIVRDAVGGGRERRPWEVADPTQARVRIDSRTRTIVVVGTESQQAEIAQVLAGLDRPGDQKPQQTEVVRVEFARASELARTLDEFLESRAATAGAGAPTVTIVPSDSANTLLLAGDAAEIATLRDLLTRLDQPGTGGDRRIEIVQIADGKADELARMLVSQFPRGTGGQGVIITPDVRTNSLIVNAPPTLFPQVMALIDRLDAKSLGDVTVIRTYALTGARADEAVRILGQTLQLDARGQTQDGAVVKLDEEDAQPVNVKARVVADRRSNSLVVSATPESFPVIEALIKRIDDVPARSPVEYRILRLEHALADEVSFTLRQIVRPSGDEPAPRIDYNMAENQLVIGATSDQFEQVAKILEQIDVPSDRVRQTDFVPIKFAGAEKVREALQYFYGPRAIDANTPGRQSVVIVADTATNSLVISADQGEWEGIRALVSKLDSEEYDASQQLRVFPLLHADAPAVARAVNDAFQGRIDRRGQLDAARRGQNAQGAADPRNPQLPTVLVESDEWVNAAAETQTNSLIVSASRSNLRKIEQIVTQIDTADFAKLPPPRIIPIAVGNPVQLAETIMRMFAPDPSERGGNRSTRGLRIVGDLATSALIVRANDDEFAQVEALAQAIQQEGSAQGLAVKVLPLKAAPAVRVAAAIREAYSAKAKQQNLPLSISVDAAGNSLVIASSAPLFAEIRATVEEMDALSPGVGQAIFVIDLEHISPEAVKGVVETIGLDKPQPENSVSKVVSEPIKISAVPGRKSVIVVANPGDRDTVVALLKALDSEPALAQGQMRVVKLKNAQAGALAATLSQILTPAPAQGSQALARAVQEQLRRLAVRRDGLKEEDLKIDLEKPIRVIPDASLNALVVASTPENVQAIEELIAMFDAVPISDAVVVQIFPLENIAADQFARIVRELFAQGKALGAVPGSKVEAVPAGTVGRALTDSVALSVDARTNTVVVAGKEDAVALVEVLVKRIDTEVATGWVEPRILPLRFANAEELSTTLNAVLVDGATVSPQANPLQQQVARLRMLRKNGGAFPVPAPTVPPPATPPGVQGPPAPNGPSTLVVDAAETLAADIFQPMTRTVIRPEPNMNALVVVATPANLEVIGELVRMLDVEAASPSASVRIYPIQHASAAKLAAIVQRVFEQQFQAKSIRAEDRISAQADERSNALVVSTSPRSFAVLENLLKSLDAPIPIDLKEIRTIELKHASAARLAQMIQQLMDARLERLRRVQPETADLERALVIADLRSNSLVIAAGNDTFDVIKRVAADLDVETLLTSSLVQVITLDKGNADRIRAAVQQILDRRYADLPPEVRQSQRPMVLTDTRSNSLLVAAAPEDFDLIRDLVSKLEAAPINPAVGVHVIALTSGRAETLAPRVEALMQSRRQSLGPGAMPSDAVSIQPESASNSLIVAASNENAEIIRELVGVLTEAEAAGGGRAVEILTLTASRAVDLVPVLNEMYVNEENRRRGQDSVRVTTEPRLNAVVVTGDPGDVEALRTLVARLDGTRPETVVEIKYIPLASANALETVSLVENVLSGRSLAGRAGRQATVLKYMRAAGAVPGSEGTPGEATGSTETQVSAAIRESINLTPDVRTNTIIVSAPRDSMEMIERMIRDLDASTVGAQNIRVFRLINADAEAMAEILKALFSLEQRGDLLVLKPRESGASTSGDDAGGRDAAATGGASPQGLAGVELSAVPDERQQLSITVDSRTNSLLVSATPTYLDLVAQVVKELDAQEANERETNIYRLKNAVAAEVARVVSTFVEQDQQKLIGTLGSDQLPSAARLLEREVTIVGDDKTNTVLINASPRYMARVEDIIKELDVDPPQVLIQVLLAEITLDATTETGVDMATAFDIGEYTLGAGFELASIAATSVGVPTVPFSKIPQIAVTGPDFSLLIKALQSQGRLQVLSNPSVMAANNEEADIQVGETIRVPESTSFVQGQQQSSVVAEDIGIILKVTPSINPDGFVRMDINPEISELSQRTTQISEDFEAPIITRRRANTTVTVRDGETIVIGGLISDRYEKRGNKVPILGDIPVIGFFFRRDIETVAKTELLIVITPHVVMSPSSLQVERGKSLTDEQINRLSLPDWMKDQIRKGELEGLEQLYDDEGRPIEDGAFQKSSRRRMPTPPPGPSRPGGRPESMSPNQGASSPAGDAP